MVRLNMMTLATLVMPLLAISTGVHGKKTSKHVSTHSHTHTVSTHTHTHTHTHTSTHLSKTHTHTTKTHISKSTTAMPSKTPKADLILVPIKKHGKKTTSIRQVNAAVKHFCAQFTHRCQHLKGPKHVFPKVNHCARYYPKHGSKADKGKPIAVAECLYVMNSKATGKGLSPKYHNFTKSLAHELHAKVLETLPTTTSLSSSSLLTVAGTSTSAVLSTTTTSSAPMTVST